MAEDHGAPFVDMEDDERLVWRRRARLAASSVAIGAALFGAAALYARLPWGPPAAGTSKSAPAPALELATSPLTATPGKVTYIPGYTHPQDLRGASVPEFELPTTVAAANKLLATYPLSDGSYEALFKSIPAATIEALFEDFLVSVGTNAARPGEERKPRYDGNREHAHRLKVFSDNLLSVMGLNAKQQAGSDRPDHARFGITVFADWTEQEFRELMLGGVRAPKAPLAVNVSSSPPKPKGGLRSAKGSQSCTFDSYIVLPARNQGQCGDCWAVTAGETMRMNYFWKEGVDPGVLSAEYFVECEPDVCGAVCDGGLNGCCGGWPLTAFEWAATVGGAPTFDDYGDQEHAIGIYPSTVYECKADVPLRLTCDGGYYITENAQHEERMPQALCENGAIAIVVASEPMQHYVSGVLDAASCPPDMVDHAIVLTGMDSAGDFWIARNSWGDHWGINPRTYGQGGGHLLMKYGENTCNLANAPAVPKNTRLAGGTSDGATAATCLT